MFEERQGWVSWQRVACKVEGQSLHISIRVTGQDWWHTLTLEPGLEDPWSLLTS